MNRLRGLTLALIAVLLLPLAASAQRETRETREGSKFIGLAMTKQSPDERAEQYRQALVHLRPAMESDADNPRVWLLAGQALAGMGQIAEADRVFKRALELQPDYAEEIEAERHDAWIGAFQLGVAAMEADDPQRAVDLMKQAELIYSGRPEAHLYMGVMYANDLEDYVSAERAFRAALAATHGPLLETLEPEAQQEWIDMRTSLRHNIERMLMTLGVTYFSDEQFADAAESFRSLTEHNPYSRDGWFNLCQALLAQSRLKTDELDALEGAAADQRRQELLALQDDIEAVTKKAMELDPQAEILYYMLANAHTVRGNLHGTEEAVAEGQRRAYEVIQAHEALDFTIDEINVIPEEASIRITGVLKNRKLAPGAEVRLKLTLVNMDGETVGEDVVAVAAPAVDESVTFEVTLDATGEIAGWRYEVVAP
ncbi:hypothetical protein BH23GEM10_BH23GEM10_12480 [soil metagenome]